MILKPDLDDAIGITAFAILGILMLLVVITLGMVALGIAPFAWSVPVSGLLVAAFAGLVIASEVIR